MAPLIRVIGSLNVDMVSVTPRFPDAGETITASSYFMSAGGKGANQAVASGRASRRESSPGTSAVNIEMVGAVGGLDGHFDALLKPTSRNPVSIRRACKSSRTPTQAWQ